MSSAWGEEKKIQNNNNLRRKKIRVCKFFVQVISNMAHSVTRTQCSALPKGWVREEHPRLSYNTHAAGSASKVDVFYVSPAGKRVR
jgi:Methyl-CpG binding domain